MLSIHTKKNPLYLTICNQSSMYRKTHIKEYFEKDKNMLHMLYTSNQITPKINSSRTRRAAAPRPTS